MRNKVGLYFGVVTAAFLTALWPATAFAEDPSPVGEVPANVLIIMAGVATAYLLAHLLLGWLTSQYGFVTGVQYVVLGMIVVPLTGWLPSEIVADLRPLIALAAGAVGLGVGLRVSFRELASQKGPTVKLTFIVTALTLAMVVVIPVAGLYYWTPETAQWHWVPAILALGAMALVADGRQLVALAKFFDVPDEKITQARELAWLSTALSVVGFGLVFSFYNPGQLIVDGIADGALWLVAHLVAGGIIGALGAAMMQARPDEDRVLTILLGVVIMASTLAYTTTLSVVFINFVAGAVLFNMSSESLRIRRMLESANIPLYILLLFFAGTLWTPEMAPIAFVFIGAYLLLRMIGRVFGVMLYRPRLSGHRPDPGIHRVLWAPGALSAAMIVDFAFGFEALTGIEVVLSLFVLILIAEEIISHFLIRGWMIDISDPESSQGATSPWGQWEERR